MSGAKTQENMGLTSSVAWAAAWLLASNTAFACGGGAVQSALQTPQVAAKFSLAAQACGQGASTLSPTVAPASSHAQQLSMYDAVATAAPDAGTVPPATSPAAASPQPGAAPRKPKSMGRDSTARAVALVPQISRVAEQYGIDPLLLHAIAHVESRHNPEAMSHAGAVGLMQVMPATARRFGVTSPQTELRDPRISLEVSSAYLKTLQKRFDNNLPLIIAAYNAGEGAVEKYGRRIPPYKETQGYVRDVLSHYRLLVSTRDAVRPPPSAAL